MNLRTLIILSAAIGTFSSGSSQAQIVLWNAPVNGSLYEYSNGGSTQVNHFVGVASDSADLVESSVTYMPTGNGNAYVYPDLFSFTVPVGRELSKLNFSNTFNYSNAVYGEREDYLQVGLANAAGTSLGSIPFIYGPQTEHNILQDINLPGLSSGTYSLFVIGGYSAPAYEPQPTQNVVMNYTTELDTISVVPEPSTVALILLGLGTLVFFSRYRRLA